MNREAQLQRLLSRWRATHQQGQPVSPVDLCRDCPELLPDLQQRIAEFETIERALNAAGSPSLHDAATLALDTDGPADSTPLAPPSVAGYQIMAELGRGGMGVVYQARQTKLNRLVALKMILSGGHASSADLARFRTEAEAIARLQHPNIVHIYEVGEHNGLPFLSLEFCAGGNLEKKLQGKALAPGEAVALVEKLARAMHAAHQKGVIHRDLKPANILLAEDGSPKITDFGLARKLDEASQTASGTMLGTPSYMAPEQAGGKKKELGPPVDIYALGAILYECLTGRPPFQAATALDTLLEVASVEPVAPRVREPNVPRDLDTICLKCLEKNRRDRYASAEELAEDLARFARGEPIQARPIGRLERAWRWCRRNPALAGLSALASALVIALVVILLLRKQPGPASDHSWQRVKDRGKVVIAMDPACPPMAFRQEGKLVGFDVDLSHELARGLGVEAEFVLLDWNWRELTKRLHNRRIDLIISAVTVTEERKQDVDFIDYLSSPLVYVCARGVTVRDRKDLAGKIVAVQGDTVAQKLIEDFQRQGTAVKQILVLPTTTGPFEAVQNGKADLTLDHKLIAGYFARQYPRLDVQGNVGHALVPESLGIALHKQDKELQGAVTQALKDMNRDGTFAKLLEKWFP
jgi:ABC-type amino acid transport substrate-binding protein/tRNA A-37 threonylcarbamoyl transferase component Bud32